MMVRHHAARAVGKLTRVTSGGTLPPSAVLMSRLSAMMCRCIPVRVVIRNTRGCSTTLRRLTHGTMVLDDTLSEHRVRAVLDARVPSLSAAEGCWTARSRRAPSQAMLDACVSHTSTSEDA